MNEDPTGSRAKSMKIPTTCGKEKGKGKAHALASPEVSFDSDRVYVTHLTTCETEYEHHDLQDATSEPEDEYILKAWSVKLHS